MKLLVFSDSHRETEHMLLAVRREKPEVVLHLGDYASDAEAISEEFPYLPMYAVRGNCDYFDSRAPEQALLQWQGVRIFLTHGHRYGVKQSLLRMEYAAREKEAQLALFGHTHCPYCEENGGVWLLNPGACGGRIPTYGVIEIENGRVSCHVTDIYKEE